MRGDRSRFLNRPVPSSAGSPIALQPNVIGYPRQFKRRGIRAARVLARNFFAIYLAALCALAAGCEGATGPSSVSASQPSQPPSAISVNVSPGNTSALLGDNVALTAVVSNTSNTAVTWSVAGIPEGNTTVGTISASGVFSAPPILPVPPSVIVQATSVADPTKMAIATITISSDIGVTIAPAAAIIELGAQQALQASITSAGKPSSSVTWMVSGGGCSGTACGTVTSAGLFTAPQILPLPQTVAVTATSVADPSKSASAIITVASRFTFTVSGPSSINTGASAGLTATLTPLPNSNPAAAISWTVSGAGCAGSACGVITPTGSGASANYTAPAAAPAPNQVTISAIPLADPSKAASITVTILSTNGAIQVTLAPASATLSIAQRQTFTAQVSNAPSSNVTWQVNGIPGGNTVVGQICVVNSNPCQPVASPASSVDYLAPAAVPSLNPVQLQATTVGAPTASAAASITILPHVVVSVSPPSAVLPPGAQQPFSASVAGTSDQQVTWNVSGAACAAAGAPCGVIDATGLYTAPAAAPSPGTFAVVATSSEDTTQTGSAAVTITLQPTILSLSPSSATAGAAGGFTLLVEGGNFVLTSPGPGSTLVIGGSARNTVCSSTASCTTTLAAQDLAVAENLSVVVQNPNGSTSNGVSFVVIPPPAGGTQLIPITPGAPSVTGENIIVVDLSTNGSSSPSSDVSLAVVAVGPYQPSTGTCSLESGPVTLVRPSSGAATVDICAFSVGGLDPSLAYTLSGPTPGDVSIAGTAPLGLGIVDVTLLVPSTAVPGVRTLFIQNANLDTTAGTGAIVVQ